MPIASWCSPTASCCSRARRASWGRRSATAPATSRRRSCGSCTRRATDVRWLLLKDLQILRRSPLLVALLLAYGGIVGALLGFAVQRDDTKPKVAFLNEGPSSAGGIQGGAQKIDAPKDPNKPFRSAHPIPRKTPAPPLAQG